MKVSWKGFKEDWLKRLLNFKKKLLGLLGKLFFNWFNFGLKNQPFLRARFFLPIKGPILVHSGWNFFNYFFPFGFWKEELFFF